MIEIQCVSRENQMADKAIEYIWGIWGNKSNHDFYADCIKNSTDPDRLPKFYLAFMNGRVAGCYALLTNDLISRQDLYPWLACLYVMPELRNRGIGGLLLAHGVDEAKRLGFNDLYLNTDHTGYYEKYGWIYMCEGVHISNVRTKIYTKSTGAGKSPSQSPE